MSRDMERNNMNEMDAKQTRVGYLAHVLASTPRWRQGLELPTRLEETIVVVHLHRSCSAHSHGLD